MSNPSFLRLFFFLFVFVPGLCSGQWTKTNGLSGGPVNSFLRLGDTVLVSSGRLYYSTNDGQSWTPLTNTNNPIIHRAVTDGTNLYAQGYQDGVGRVVSFSADFGQTWTSAAVPDSLYFYDFFAWQGYMYGADYRGIYRSTDQGVHWEFVTTQPFSSVKSDGQRIVASSGNKLMESLDGGFTWHTLLQFSGYVINILQEENYLFVFLQNSNEGCWASSDYGQTWQHFTGTGFEQINGFLWHDGTLFALDLARVYRSTDLGNNWEELNIPNLSYSAVTGISSGGSVLIGGFDKGILRSTDNGDSWFRANQGLLSGLPGRLGSTDQGLFAPGAEGIFKLQPDGVNWNNMHYDITLPMFSERYTTFLKAGDYLIVGVDGDKCFVSIDNGETWVESSIAAWGSTGDFTPLGMIDGKVLATNNFASQNNLYISDNDGLTFLPLNTFTTQTNTYSQLSNFNEGQLYSLGYDGKIYYTNNGNDWSVLSPNFPIDSLDLGGSYGEQLYVRGNSIWIFDRNISMPKMAFSVDAGQNWTIYNINEANFNWGTYPFFDIINVGNYLIAATTRGAFISSDGGLHWEAWSEGLILSNVVSLYVYDGYVWAGVSGDGIWKRPLSELGLQTGTGTVFHDVNNNGQQDNGEPGLPNVIVQSTTSNSYTNTRSDGTFSLLSSFPQEQIKVHLPAPYWTASPASQTITMPATEANFALSIDLAARNLSVVLTNVAALQPGFEVPYVLTWRNEVPSPATDVAIELAYPPDQLEFISAVPAPASQSTGLLKWQPGEVAANALGLIHLTFKVPATVELGKEICATATINPVQGDFSPDDNVREHCATVVGSFDPNDKQAKPDAQITPNAIATQQPVVYTIRFQNTGNFPATFVRINDTLSQYFDPATFRLLSSSHPCTWNLRHAGELEIDFQNIQLPPVTTDEPGSHGFVQYSVQARPDVPLGTPLRNTAHIFFDYNAPVITNTTETVVSLLNPVHSPGQNFTMNIFPNPASDFVRLELPMAGLVTVTNVLGHIIWQSSSAAGLTQLNVGNWPNGTYRLGFKNGEMQSEKVFVVQR